MGLFDAMIKSLNKFYTKQAKHELKDVEINPGSYVDVNIQVPEGYTGMMITVKATFNANASSGLRVMYLYSHDGVNYDSEDEAVSALNYFDMFTAGATKQRSDILPAVTPFVKIRLRNMDANHKITGVNVWRVIIR
jgi:hypothetical protein